MEGTKPTDNHIYGTRTILLIGFTEVIDIILNEASRCSLIFNSEHPIKWQDLPFCNSSVSSNYQYSIRRKSEEFIKIIIDKEK